MVKNNFGLIFFWFFYSLLLTTTLALAQNAKFESINRVASDRLRPNNQAITEQVKPVAILKQINRHNEDGSYTYGYESGDGSFKIETKLATGEVKGKYGYVDEAGKVRIVEYGANKYGFQPSGEGITVAPPTLVDETTDKEGYRLSDYEDNTSVIPNQKPYIAKVSRPQPRPITQSHPQYLEYEEQNVASRNQQFQQIPLSAKAPPQHQDTGSIPTDVIYAEQPRPLRPGSEYHQSQNFAPQERQQGEISRSSIPAPQLPPQMIQYLNPRPVSAQSAPTFHTNQPAHHTIPYNQQGRSVSVLDQLAKDYALPQGSKPLHDISFGYY